MEVLIMAALVLVNGGYIAYLHRHLRRLEERHQALAAADRRLVVTAREVGGELRALAADLVKHENAACKQYEKLSSYMSVIIKDHLLVDLAPSRRNGHGRAKGQAPASGRTPHERPGIPPYDELN